MGNLTSTETIIVIILIAIVFILMGIVLFIDYMSKKKNETIVEEKTIDDQKVTTEKIDELPSENLTFTLEPQKEEQLPEIVPIVNDKKNINRISEIKYVEEDEENEKTKAKLELEQLKEELRHQEETKKEEEKKVEIVQEKPKVEQPIINEAVKEETKVGQTVINETIKEEPIVEQHEEVSQIASNIEGDLVKEEKSIKEANLVKANEVQEDLKQILASGIDAQIEHHEDEQEKSAIISVEQFNKVSDALYDSNEVVQSAYEDEGNEPISLGELETLYNTREMQAIKLDDFNTIKEEEKKAIIADADIKRLEDLPPIAMEKKFKSSPFISPVYGISETKESIELEQTANLDKLNEEIKKTNEFLKALKELQKNLD